MVIFFGHRKTPMEGVSSVGMTSSYGPYSRIYYNTKRKEGEERERERLVKERCFNRQ